MSKCVQPFNGFICVYFFDILILNIYYNNKINKYIYLVSLHVMTLTRRRTARSRDQSHERLCSSTVWPALTHIRLLKNLIPCI